MKKNPAIDQLKFAPVPEWLWESIEVEGLDEEYNSFKKTDWLHGILPISKQDAYKLSSFDKETIEKYNKFDIWLKDKYNMKYIDLIDYENGIVYIVTSIKSF